MKAIASMILVMLFAAGCVTQPVDWQMRVGSYTRDQAIKDFGPPDQSAKLADGFIVDQWITQHRHIIEAPEPYFLPAGDQFATATPAYSEVYAPDHYLQLTFGTDGRLKAWKQFMK